MTADIHALTGAYALNAIPEAERAQFERHLAECESCRQEVQELRATATRLGEAAEEQPPPALKAAVLARIAEVRQQSPLNELAARRAKSPWPTRIFGAAAAVLLVVSVSLGVLLVRSNQEADSGRQQVAAMAELLRADDARIVSGTTADGLSGTVVVSRHRGQVMLLADNIPAAPDGKTYQAWLIGDGPKPKSIGVFEPDQSGRASLVDASGVQNATTIGVTVEPDGGSTEPSLPAVMEMALPV
ncbi:anti-sigma factor [Actinokineospora sp. HUAS TT18]|uniref:anti-sigma factor n=1 Tax=Actinokineospora sp. HUAS TT18 TaxID=3447451 RepID=UPI003F52033C